jgi:ABC-type Fe3+/spermidine/putrescine transport system ATPase subunit
MIRAENLSFKYDQRGIAGVHSLSFKVNEGEIFGIIGPNGSGKTTLLKLLSGQINPHEGKIVVNSELSIFKGTEVETEINVQKFLFEHISLNLDDEKKIQLIRDLADTFEFTFQLRQNVKELSSGQKQKVLLSKELINRPQILLMDEPFSHLDPYSREDILKSLFKHIKQQNMTVIWITHELNEVFKFSDRIALMNYGHFEQVSTSENFIVRPENLFVAQFVGYRNFFPIRYDQGKWTSPWGKINFPPLESEDGILVVPDHAWTLNSEGVKFCVRNRYAGKQCLHYELESEFHKIFMTRSPDSRVWKVESELYLSPILNSCFVIKL